MARESIPISPPAQRHVSTGRFQDIYCDCVRIAFCLGRDDTIPEDDLCWPVPADSVATWETDEYLWSLPTLRELADAVPWRYDTRNWLTPAPARALLPAQAPIGLSWLPTVDGRLLGLVIRQWAYEAPNHTLARQLENDRTWLLLVKLRRFWCEVAPNQAVSTADAVPYAPLDITADDWDVLCSCSRAPFPEQYIRQGADGTRVWAQGDEPFVVAVLDRWISRHIERLGLPHSPETLEHLRACSRKEDGTLPARALLVTTLVFVRPLAGQAQIIHDNNPALLITGALGGATQALLDNAAHVVSAHRTWVEAYGQAAVDDIAEKRRAQKGSFAHKQPDRTGASTDYVTSRLSGEWRDALMDQAAGMSREDWVKKIKEDINLTDDRVSKYRTEHGTPRQSRKIWVAQRTATLWGIYDQAQQP